MQNSKLKFKIYKFLLTLLPFAFCLLPLNKAYAEAISLAVDPPILQINAIPPADIISPLSLENRGDSQLNVKVEFRPFTASDQENGGLTYVGEKDANLADPLFFQRVSLQDEKGQNITEFSVDPKEKKKFNLSINLPKDSPQADYYFSIVFLSSANSSNNVSSSQNVSGIASNVLLSVGAGKVTGEIEEFSSPIFMEKGPVPFTLRVKNTSNHFITPKGEILIKNFFGQTIGRVDLAQVNILANSVRNVPSQDFSVPATWPQNFILGPYKANLSIALSDTGPLFRRSLIFFAFPAKETGIIITVLVFLLYVAIKVRSNI